MRTPKAMLTATVIGLATVALPACGDAGGTPPPEDATTTTTTAPETPTTTTEPTTTTTVPSTTATPTTTEPATTTGAPPEVWDLVWISDSSGWRVADAYAVRIEADLGVQVEVHDLWGVGLPARLILEALRGERNVPSTFQGGVAAIPLIEEAEVIVIHGNPLMSETPGHPISDACVTGSEECGEPECEPEGYAQFEADLAAIYDEIFAIRDEEPVILRTYDLYLAPDGVDSWRECAVELERMCTQCLVNFSDAIHRVAADHGVPVAGLLRGFSGPDLDQDMPREFVSDGIHPSPEGAAAIAEIFANLGYELSQGAR